MSFFDQARRRDQPEPSRFFLSLLLREVHASASQAEEHAFLVAVGHKLAEAFPLSGDGDLRTIEQDMNRTWNALSSGAVALAADDDGLLIRHALPFGTDGGEADDEWIAALPAILEGAYDGWLRMLGSGPRLRTTRIGGDGRHIEFRHGL